MSEHSETLAEIVAEMRGMGNYQQYSGDHARALADRIEAGVEAGARHTDIFLRPYQGRKVACAGRFGVGNRGDEVRPGVEGHLRRASNY